MASLGDTLRERRAALGVTLEQAEAATRIRSRLLAALENGDYDILPNPGYVRGYISSYGRFLELDPQALLQLYKAETGLLRAAELNLPQIDEAVPRTGEQHAIPWRAALPAAAVVALVSLAVWGIVSLSSGSRDLEPEPVPVTGTETGTAPSDASSSGSTGDTRDESPEANDASPDARPFSLAVIVSETGASWMRVSVDGKTAYEGTLAGGQTKTFEVAREASVRVGKPSAVTILRDGQPVTIPDGDTPTVNLKAELP